MKAKDGLIWVQHGSRWNPSDKSATAATHSSARRCQSDPLETSVLACRRCGCRMVTKVGRGGNLLICSDCGVPVEQRQGQLDIRQRLFGALALIGLTLVGGMIFFLAAMEERLASKINQSGQRESGGVKGEGDQRLRDPALVAPDPKPIPSIISPDIRPVVPSKPVTAAPARGDGPGKPDHSSLPLPLKLRNQPGNGHSEP